MDAKVLLIILDGWGLSSAKTGNAPLLAKTPTLDHLYATYPKTSLSASGLEVGLSAGEPGNSEVGHLNIGSGRVVWENLPKIDQAIESGKFAANETLLVALNHAVTNKSALHLIGLVSDGGVHSHIRHAQKLIELAAAQKISEVYLHFISDGRDTEPQGSPHFIAAVEETCAKCRVGKIATIVGRYFAMDRDKNWDREKKAYDLFTLNTGNKAESAREAVEASYAAGKTDEFIEPVVIASGGKIGSKDSIIFFNHRSDRSRQMLSLFEKLKNENKDLCLTSMTQYYKEQTSPVIFPPENLSNTLSDVVSAAGIQLHTAETEKFAHVTYFFRGGNETPPPQETDTIVPSQKVPTYDQLPEMSALAVTKTVIDGLNKNEKFLVVNFANGDMVGHTGVLAAAIKACEVLDQCLHDVIVTASRQGYKVFITADHGNCETMINEDDTPNTEHTSNPVPLVFLDLVKKPFDAVTASFSPEDYFQYVSGTPIGVLADIAPSVLVNLGLDKAAEMSGMDLSIAMR